MEVLIPGSVGKSMVNGVSPEQYREINEFGLSEQSRHWAAFGNALWYDHQRKKKYGGALSRKAAQQEKA